MREPTKTKSERAPAVAPEEPQPGVTTSSVSAPPPAPGATPEAPLPKYFVVAGIALTALAEAVGRSKMEMRHGDVVAVQGILNTVKPLEGEALAAFEKMQGAVG